MLSPSLSYLSEAEFIRLVAAAYRNFDSLLELARSPLSLGGLIAPALVLDESSPTPDDRGRALRVLLRWAVNRMAPGMPRFPLGHERSFIDPTWHEPLWWRYNLLRHTYIEPLHPDLLEGITLDDKLLELTGIDCEERLIEERSRAVHEAALLIQEHLLPGRAAQQTDDELRRNAIEDYLQEAPQPARSLLDVAATFRWVFRRSLLVEIANNEQIPDIDTSINYLIGQRMLVVGDQGASLYVPPLIQSYLSVRQTGYGLSRRHLRAARFYKERGHPLRAAWHLRIGGQANEAVDLLAENARELVSEGQLEEAQDVLEGFIGRQLTPERWQWVQERLAEINQRMEKPAPDLQEIEPQPSNELVPVEQIALETARAYGSVTPRMLVERGFSKSTATRHLAELAQRGLLIHVGQGRASAYIIRK